MAIIILTHKMIELKEETHLMILFILFSVFINFIGNNFFFQLMEL